MACTREGWSARIVWLRTGAAAIQQLAYNRQTHVKFQQLWHVEKGKTATNCKAAAAEWYPHPSLPTSCRIWMNPKTSPWDKGGTHPPAHLPLPPCLRHCSRRWRVKADFVTNHVLATHVACHQAVDDVHEQRSVTSCHEKLGHQHQIHPNFLKHASSGCTAGTCCQKVVLGLLGWPCPTVWTQDSQLFLVTHIVRKLAAYSGRWDCLGSCYTLLSVQQIWQWLHWRRRWHWTGSEAGRICQRISNGVGRWCCKCSMNRQWQHHVSVCQRQVKVFEKRQHSDLLASSTCRMEM